MSEAWLPVWVAMQELGAALNAMPDDAECPPEVAALAMALDEAQEVVGDLAQADAEDAA